MPPTQTKNRTADMAGICTIRLTVPIVPFVCNELRFDVDDEHVNSPFKTLGHLADLVSNNIGRHTDNFSLWNRYAQACLERAGNKIVKYCISFQDDQNKTMELSSPPHFWAVYLTHYKANILVTFYRKSELQYQAHTWFIQTQRMLQQAHLVRGYIVIMDPICLPGQDDEEMRYSYDHKVVKVTNFYNNLVCGNASQAPREDSKLAAAKRSFPTTDLAGKNAPNPVLKKSTCSNPIKRQILTVAKYAELYDLTAEEEDTK
jgi:hypothetical protein